MTASCIIGILPTCWQISPLFIHIPAVMISELQLFSLLKNGVFVHIRVFTAVYLEEVAVEHSDDQQHLLIGHVASAHLESRGWDVNPTVSYCFFSLNTQKLIRTGRRIKSEYHIYVKKIWPHFLRHIYPQMVEIKMPQSLPTGGNFPLVTPINTQLISYNTLELEACTFHAYLCLNLTSAFKL